MPTYRTPPIADLAGVDVSHRTTDGSTFVPAAIVLVIDPLLDRAAYEQRVVSKSVRSTYEKARAEAEALAAREQNAARIVLAVPLYRKDATTGWVAIFTPDVVAVAAARNLPRAADVIDRFIGADVLRLIAERDERRAAEERERVMREERERAERVERERRELAEREAAERAARERNAARNLRTWRANGAECAFCAARVDGANVGTLDGRPACGSCVEEIADDRRRAAAGAAPTVPGSGS